MVCTSTQRNALLEAWEDNFEHLSVSTNLFNGIMHCMEMYKHQNRNFEWHFNGICQHMVLWVHVETATCPTSVIPASLQFLGL